MSTERREVMWRALCINKQGSWVQILTLPPTYYVILGKLLASLSYVCLSV